MFKQKQIIRKFSPKLELFNIPILCCISIFVKKYFVRLDLFACQTMDLIAKIPVQTLASPLVLLYFFERTVGGKT